MSRRSPASYFETGLRSASGYLGLGQAGGKAALGQGRNTLSALQQLFDRGGASRLHRVTVVPAGSATTPHFDYAGKLADLGDPSPAWPLRAP